MKESAARLPLLPSTTLGVILWVAVMLGGCASLPEGSRRSERDPWERYNRAMHEFNDTVDRGLLRPVAKGYRAITPDPVEHGISNFFDNLAYPVVILNQFLQGDFADGTRDTGRFVVNTVIGIGGIFDPASHMGLERNNEDFGQTLAVWGVPSGPYLVLPFLGPSTVSDTVGVYADSEVNPLFEVVEPPEEYYLIGLNVISLRAQLLDIDGQLQNTFDPYAFLRDAYLQRREFLIHDGNPPREDFYDELYEDLENFEDEAPPPEDPQESQTTDQPEEQSTGADEQGTLQEPLPE